MVDELYYIATYQKTYEHAMALIDLRHVGNSETFYAPQILLTLSPRKGRRRSCKNMKVRESHCSRCGDSRHNMRTCVHISCERVQSNIGIDYINILLTSANLDKSTIHSAPAPS